MITITLTSNQVYFILIAIVLILQIGLQIQLSRQKKNIKWLLEQASLRIFQEFAKTQGGSQNQPPTQESKS